MQENLLDNIEVLPFKFKHYPMLLDMLEAQKYPDLSNAAYKTLPKIGYIALIDNNPIAAGFLRRVEGNVMAQLDGLTSNPYFGSIIRHQGITKIVNQLIEDAKQLKLKGIYAMTQDCAVRVRAEAIGFKKIDHSVIVLSIGD